MPHSLMDKIEQVLWVVTSGTLEKPAGLIATSVMQFSISPRCVRYVVVLAKPHHTCACALETGVLTLHLFDEAKLDFVERFGTRHGPDQNKFTGLELGETESGGVVILDAPAWGVGQVFEQVDLGDRIAFMLEIKIQQVYREFKPLTWNRFSQLATPELIQLLRDQLEVDQNRDDELLKHFASLNSC